MNSNLKQKLILKLAKIKKNEGFTLIELLVVIIIIGVLSAVALPNLLGQVGQARETEARQNMGALIRGQQAYRVEEGSFAGDEDDDIGDLNDELGISIQGEFYSYGSAQDPSGTEAVMFAQAGDEFEDDIVDFQGALIQPAGGDGESIICQTDEVSSETDIDVDEGEGLTENSLDGANDDLECDNDASPAN